MNCALLKTTRAMPKENFTSKAFVPITLLQHQILYTVLYAEAFLHTKHRMKLGIHVNQICLVYGCLEAKIFITSEKFHSKSKIVQLLRQFLSAMALTTKAVSFSNLNETKWLSLELTDSFGTKTKNVILPVRRLRQAEQKLSKILQARKFF